MKFGFFFDFGDLHLDKHYKCNYTQILTFLLQKMVTFDAHLAKDCIYFRSVVEEARNGIAARIGIANFTAIAVHH